MADMAGAAPDNMDLNGDLDPKHWAQRFVAVRARRVAEDSFDIAADELTMAEWFTRAIDTGRMYWPATCTEHEVVEYAGQYEPGGSSGHVTPVAGNDCAR